MIFLRKHLSLQYHGIIIIYSAAKFQPACHYLTLTDAL